MIDYPYEAKNIISGNDVASPPWGSGDVTISDGDNIKYKAEEEVNLKPGFNSLYGSEFRAWIAPCGMENWETCDPRGTTIDLCVSSVNNCIKIGGNYSPALNYSWAPTTYLDNPNIPNPTVCLPTSGHGCVTYILTVKDNSGQQVGSICPTTIHYWTNDGLPWHWYDNELPHNTISNNWYCDLTFPYNTNQFILKFFHDNNLIYEIHLKAYVDWIPNCNSSASIHYHFDTNNFTNYNWHLYNYYEIVFESGIFCSEQKSATQFIDWRLP
jgi:hypothetical protein